MNNILFFENEKVEKKVEYYKYIAKNNLEKERRMVILSR